MFILGINAYHADASAALLKDGVLIAAIEEERFKRIKHWAGFPADAIRFVLKDAGITLNQIDHIAIGRDPSAKFLRKIIFASSHPGIGIRAILGRLRNAQQVKSLADEFKHAFPDADENLIKSKIHHIEHHRAHLASAFFASPFEESCVLSIDGSGDFTTTMLATGKGNKLEIQDSIDFPHSIGIFYSAFTQFLGFPHYGDEYKVMGLAPYGKPIYIDKLRDAVKLTSDGLFRLNLKYFNVTSGNIISYGKDHIPIVNTLYGHRLVEQFGKPRKNEDLMHYHKDLAASVQAYTEEIIFHLMKTLHKRTGLSNLCLAGGVAQNSVANGKITRKTPFKAVYIPSAGHDAGISMGAALYVHHMVLGHSRNPSIRSAYTGSRYSNNEIEELLKQEGIEYALYDDNALFEKITDRLINSGVIGWFNGRAEFGPRALGGRSILADPRRKDAKDLLNAKVKRRESFRPFAPSILKEYVGEYFEVVDEAPFMEKVFPIKKEKQALIPAVNHVDGTGRLQTVDRDINPRFYNLINRFYQKTGVPILLNTSFNENEPIVNNPKEALDCFLRTQMDMLVLENIIVERKNGLK